MTVMSQSCQQAGRGRLKHVLHMHCACTEAALPAFCDPLQLLPSIECSRSFWPGTLTAALSSQMKWSSSNLPLATRCLPKLWLFVPADTDAPPATLVVACLYPVQQAVC